MKVQNLASNLFEEEDYVNSKELKELVDRVSLFTPPLWELKDLVAVNPFLGYSKENILNAHLKISYRTGNHLLPKISDFAKLYKDGFIDLQSIKKAISECKRINTDDISVSELLNILRSDSAQIFYDNTLNRTHSLASWFDVSSDYAPKWKNHVIVDLSRFCSAFYDRGIARWNQLRLREGFFKSWKEYCCLSYAMQARGIGSFKDYISELPDEHYSAINQMIRDIGIYKTECLENYLASLLGEISGWAGFLRKEAWQVHHFHVGEVSELLAARLAYDVVLYKSFNENSIVQDWKEKIIKEPVISSNYEKGVRVKYILLNALENNYLNSVKNKFKSEKIISNVELDSQVVMCIDVRSELLRRHLRNVNNKIETYGYAGFFGLPIKIKNESLEQSNCPVLLEPSIDVDAIKSKNIITTFISRNINGTKASLKHFSKSANSTFAYVETIGFLSFLSMIKETLVPFIKSKKPNNKISYNLINITLEDKVAIAHRILKGMSLRQPLAKLVLFLGHKSECENNPQDSALACGACAGHSGEPNARIVAQLLNESDVRIGLEQKGYHIPAETIFLAGIHNTVTDEVSIFDSVPKSHQQELDSLQQSFLWASEETRKERALKIGIKTKNSNDIFLEFIKRSRDISEVSPEFALAGNASFIVAKPTSIDNVDFEGRSFIHSYDKEVDVDGSILESILTAPVIVASWINLQYFASTVDKENFGSGTKTIHNISAGIGVINGNDGDLAVGLSLESLENGVRTFHQPLRLQVFLEADKSVIEKIIMRNESLKELVKNEWIKIIYFSSRDDRYERYDDLKWVVI